MRNLVQRTIPAALLVFAASGCSRVLWRPSLVTQVPDGKEVRYRERANAGTAIAGRALGWERGIPRLITSAGDTVVIPTGAHVEVKVDHPDNHSKGGAILGYIVGVFVILADCGGEKYCGEQDLRAILGGIVGGIIGSLIRDDWISVGWGTH